VRDGQLWPETVGPLTAAVPLREAAARAACKLAALASGRGRLSVQAFTGAARAR
jgi:hypothetical protein